MSTDDRYRCQHCHRYIEHTTILGWVHINCWCDHEAEPRVTSVRTEVDEIAFIPTDFTA